MTFSLTAQADFHKQFLTQRGIQPLTVDLFLVCGQSNAAGSTPAPCTVPFTTSANVGFASQYGVRDPMMLGFPFQNGNNVTPGWGQSNAWPHFAEQWYLDTGRSSLWINFSVAGTCLRKESIPGTTSHWDVSDLTKFLAGDIVYSSGGETKSRRDMFADAVAAIRANPRLKLGRRFATWTQGEADANSASCTPAQYEERLHALIDYLVATYGIEHFGICGLGRKGADQTEVTAWETSDYAAFRAAQANVATARPDTTLIFDRAHQTGTPFNTLTVDENFLHVSGMAYQADGVHLTSEGFRCMGRTAGRNMAVALGLKTP